MIVIHIGNQTVKNVQKWHWMTCNRLRETHRSLILPPLCRRLPFRNQNQLQTIRPRAEPNQNKSMLETIFFIYFWNICWRFLINLFNIQLRFESSAQTNTTSDDEPVIIEISDEESVTIDVMCKEPSRKRFLPKSVTHQKSKQFKPNDANGSEIRSMSRDINSKRNTPANDAVENHSNDFNGIMATIDFDTRNYDASSISSPEPLVFPID